MVSLLDEAVAVAHVAQQQARRAGAPVFDGAS
jgi:hypothetical protein